MNYSLDFEPVIAGFPELLRGCAGTLFLAVSGMLIALVIGVGGVALRDSPVKVFRWLVIAFVELIRNTPFLVQIYFIFFALPLIGVRLTPTPTAILALGVNGGAYAIEIIRGGVQSIHRGQIEAGLARPAQARRVPVHRPAAGAAGRVPVPHRPVRHADADDQHRLRHRGL